MTLLLLNTTIKISVIVLAALTATALLRRRSAALRHFVLAAALACAAATPAVRLIAPAWQSASRLQVIDRPLAVFDDSSPAASVVTAQRATSRSLTAATALQLAAVIWMSGAGLAIVVLVVGLARLAWIASHSDPIVDGPWVDAAADIARRYGLHARPVILRSNQPAIVGTWGVRRANVLLPPEALDWPVERIRIVLAHELAHARRRDWIVQTGADLLSAVHWFNPFVHLARRRLRLESEQACDDSVLALGVEGSTYASELVDLARSFKSQRLVPAAPLARPSSLERRVRAMLNITLNRDPITRSASLMAAAVLAIVTVVVAGFGVSAQSEFGRVMGTITDQTGRTIAGVTVDLVNPSAQTKIEVKSDANGQYDIVGVPAGSYELTFQFTGMSTLKREGLNITGQPVEANVVMQIGSITETITVTSRYDDGTRPRVTGYAGARPVDKPDACGQSTNGGCIRAPVKIKDVRPIFPSGANAGSGSVVLLSALIDTNGYVTDVQVQRATDPAFVAPAIEAVSGWEFMPTHLDGTPINTKINVTINFTN